MMSFFAERTSSKKTKVPDSRKCYGCPDYRTNIELRELHRKSDYLEPNPFPLDVEWKNCLQGWDHWLNCRRRKESSMVGRNRKQEGECGEERNMTFFSERTSIKKHIHRRDLLSCSNWRYKVIKHYRNRAIQFRDKATTKEQQDAWNNVITWFNSILDKKFLNHNGAIGLFSVPIPDEAQT